MFVRLDQGHLSLDLCPKFPLRNAHRQHLDGFKGVMVASVHVDNFMHRALTTFSKKLEFGVADDVVFGFERRPESGIVGV